MLKPLYKLLIIIGIALGVLSGMFFVGAYQLNAARQKEETKAIASSARHALAYASVSGTESGFYYASLNEKQYSLMLLAMPHNSSFSPVIKEIAQLAQANNITLPNINLLYTNEDFLNTAGLPMLSGRFPESQNECAVNSRFSAEFGLQNGITEIYLDGKAYKITGEIKSASLMPVLSEDPTVFLSLNAGPEKPATFILIKQDEAESDISFQTRIGSINQKLSGLSFSGFSPKAHTISDIFKSVSKNNIGAIILLSLLATTFLGEGIACINIITLAKDALMSNQMQIGLKLAVGASYKNIFAEYFKELALTAIKGCFIGLSASAAAIYYINRYAAQFLFLFNLQSVLISLTATVLAVFAVSLLSFVFIIQKQPVQLLKAR